MRVGYGDQQPDGSRQTRSIEAPAPAVTAKAGGQWDWAFRVNHRENATIRTIDQPAPTLTTGHSSNDTEWFRTRPATTVQGTDRIAAHGHHEHQWDDAIKVTIEELGVLQDFPVDYPWQGTKSQRATQVGNAIPVRLARAILTEALGLDSMEAAA